MEILVLFIILVIFDLAASLWGANSSDGIASPEWLRRQHWYGFH